MELKLYELHKGQRFNFIGRHRGITFEVIEKTPHHVTYIDIATKKLRKAFSNRITFRIDVFLIDVAKTLVLTQEEATLLVDVLHQAYKISSEEEEPESKRSMINKIYLRIKD